VSSEYGQYLFYYSPYGRIIDFLLGALAAQAFVAQEADVPANAALFALCTILLIWLRFWGLDALGSSGTLLSYGLGTSPFVALGIYLLATDKTTVWARLMSSRPLVAGGEASYSIYMVQGLMLWKFATPGGTASIPAEFVLGQALIAVGAILAISIGLYAMVERPGRTLLRRLFGLSTPTRQQLDAAL